MSFRAANSLITSFKGYTKHHPFTTKAGGLCANYETGQERGYSWKVARGVQSLGKGPMPNGSQGPSVEEVD